MEATSQRTSVLLLQVWLEFGPFKRDFPSSWTLHAAEVASEPLALPSDNRSGLSNFNHENIFAQRPVTGCRVTDENKVIWLCHMRVFYILKKKNSVLGYKTVTHASVRQSEFADSWLQLWGCLLLWPPSIKSDRMTPTQSWRGWLFP